MKLKLSFSFSKWCKTSYEVNKEVVKLQNNEYQYTVELLNPPNSVKSSCVKAQMILKS